MPINAHPDFLEAEKRYLEASNAKEKLIALEDMIRKAPKHKGGENLRAQLKTRYKKLKEQLEKSKSKGKSTKIGIKKEEMQAVIVGKTNSGKSSLLSLLTNINPIISPINFTTKHPLLGTMHYAGTNIQIIEIPAFESEHYDRGLVNTADTIIILITNLEEVNEIEKGLSQAPGNRIIVFNKSDILDSNQRRKLEATLKSKFSKYPYSIISTKTQDGIEQLKGQVFQSFNKIRIFTKEPGKTLEGKSPRPIILSPGDTVKTVASKVFKTANPERLIKETKIWGPSSKFGGQKVGLQHKLKDLDVVEFKTK